MTLFPQVDGVTYEKRTGTFTEHLPPYTRFGQRIGPNLAASWEEASGFCTQGCYWACEHRGDE